MAQRVSQAALALKCPDGRWARAEALLSAMGADLLRVLAIMVRV
jgi:hypothetical protein